MRLAALAGNSHRRNYLSIVTRICVSVDDRKEVLVLFCIIAAPYKDVGILFSKGSSGKKKHEQSTKHLAHDSKGSTFLDDLSIKGKVHKRCRLLAMRMFKSLRFSGRVKRFAIPCHHPAGP